METHNMAYDMCRHYVNDLADAQDWKDSVLGFIRSRNLAKLCSVRDFVNTQCISVDSFRALLQIEAFFKKNELFSDPVICKEAAVSSFIKAENRCRRTNKRLNHFYLHPDRLDPDMKLVVERARSWIKTVLGPLGDFTSRIPELVRVTGGATADQSRRKSLPFLKVKRNIEVTSLGVPYVEAIFKYLNLGTARCKVTSYNRVEFVPKNWKTYRTIACEPTGNIPFQLAFDSYVKDRLLRKGINLRSQSLNQELARRGSIDGSFATIDLASASDTVSLNTCAWLFPPEWFEYMRAFRSHLYRHPETQKLTSYEKFSSMGNGMTFCIETLVFAALSRACGSRDGTVYGDDICIETYAVPLLNRSLLFFGFEVNLDKSFVEGPYRESCGTHWFEGKLITPFFVRGKIDLKPFLSHNVNGCISISLPHGLLWRFLKSITRQEKLLLVPFNEDSTSGVFIDKRNALQVRRLRCNQQTGWVPMYKRYVFRSLSTKAPGLRSLLLWYHDSFRVTAEGDYNRVRSRYESPLERYRQRKVTWNFPSKSEPDYLPEWSEFVTRES